MLRKISNQSLNLDRAASKQPNIENGPFNQFPTKFLKQINVFEKQQVAHHLKGSTHNKMEILLVSIVNADSKAIQATV